MQPVLSVVGKVPNGVFSSISEVLPLVPPWESNVISYIIGFTVTLTVLVLFDVVPLTVNVVVPLATAVTTLPLTVTFDSSFEVIVYSSSTFVTVIFVVSPLVKVILSGDIVAKATDFNQCAWYVTVPVTSVWSLILVPPVSNVYHPSNI